MKALLEAYGAFIKGRVDIRMVLDLLYAPFEKNILRYQVSLNVLNVIVGIMIGSLLYRLALYFSLGTIFTIILSVIVVVSFVFHQMFTAELIRQNLQYIETIKKHEKDSDNIINF